MAGRKTQGIIPFRRALAQSETQKQPYADFEFELKIPLFTTIKTMLNDDKELFVYNTKDQNFMHQYLFQESPCSKCTR